VTTVVQRGGQEKPFVSKGTSILAVPISVVVNEQTASGAEIAWPFV